MEAISVLASGVLIEDCSSIGLTRLPVVQEKEGPFRTFSAGCESILEASVIALAAKRNH